MKISLFLLALLVAGPAAKATKFVFGDLGGFSPGFAQRDPVVVNVGASITLNAPGTYTAASWSISGEVRLAIPGNYVLVASNGSVAFNSSASIRGPSGPAGGVTNLVFAHTGDLIFSNPRVDPTVTIIRGAPVPSQKPPLLNISTRVSLAAEQTHISGFVVGGRTDRQILVRAVGPSLAGFGIGNVLAAPVLTVLNGQGGVVQTNSGWGDSLDLSQRFLFVGAFPLLAGSRDAAMFLTLSPGAYSVQVSGGAGEVLLEIYYFGF